jgi:hypothetical protein
MREEHFRGFGGSGRRHDNDLNAVFVMVQVEVEKGAAQPFPRDEFFDLGPGFTVIDETKHQPVAVASPQMPASKIAYRRNARLEVAGAERADDFRFRLPDGGWRSAAGATAFPPIRRIPVGHHPGLPFSNCFFALERG